MSLKTMAFQWSVMVGEAGGNNESNRMALMHTSGHMNKYSEWGKKRIRPCNHKIRFFPHSLYLCLQTTIVNGRNDD